MVREKKEERKLGLNAPPSNPILIQTLRWLLLFLSLCASPASNSPRVSPLPFEFVPFPIVSLQLETLPLSTFFSPHSVPTGRQAKYPIVSPSLSQRLPDKVQSLRWFSRVLGEMNARRLTAMFRMSLKKGYGHESVTSV